MFFSLFSKYKKNKHLVLLIDIGSASVAAALADIEPGVVPNILATARKDITFQEKLSPPEFLRSMNQALERVLKSVQEKTKKTGIPATIFCSLSSPWFLLKSRHIAITEEKPITITQSSLDKILDEGIAQLKAELKETLPPEDMRIVEKKIIQTKLNGYEIKNPYGQKAARVELTMTVGVSSKQVTDRIERTVQNFFHNDPIHFGAFPVAAFSVIRDIFPTEKSFLFLDITGESTDVSLINNDVLAGTITFPRGKNFIVREISSRFNMPHEAATSVLNMFLGGALDSKRHNEILALMTKVESDWLARFEKTLTSLGASGIVSRKIFFMSDIDVAELFTGILGKAKVPLSANKNFDIQSIEPAVLEKFATSDPGTVRDPFLVTETLLAAKVVPQFIK